MKGGFVLTPRAQGDLEEIWDYTVDRWGSQQAEQYIRQLWQDIEALVQRPARGRKCPEVKPGYYRYPSGSHVLFYRREADEIEIVRIVHRRMDYEQTDFD